MSFVFLVCVVAILNLAFGYVLAVYLGFGPPSLADAWRALAPVQPVEMAGDDPDAGPTRGPPTEQLPGSSLGVIPPAVPPEASHPAPPVETIDLDTFRQFVASSVFNLNAFAIRLKAGDGEDRARTGGAFATELHEMCKPYLKRLGQVMEHPAAGISDNVGELVFQQIAQLETTLNNLQYMDFASNASAAIERLGQETVKMLTMARALHEALQAMHEPNGPERLADSPQSAQSQLATSA